MQENCVSHLVRPVLGCPAAPTVMVSIRPMVSVSVSSWSELSSESDATFLTFFFFFLCSPFPAPVLVSLLGPGQMGAPMKCPAYLHAWHS